MIVQIPQKTLNILQVLINKFIWGYKKLRLKAKIIPQKGKQGGMSVPKTAKYQVTWLTAITQWWKQETKFDSWHLEQLNVPAPLKDWLLLLEKYSKLMVTGGSLQICKVLKTIWDTFLKELAPGNSPASPSMKFQGAIKTGDFFLYQEKPI